MVQRWPAMLTGPEGQRAAFKRAVDVPPGWRARRPETQAEIDAVHGVAAEPSLEELVQAELDKREPEPDLEALVRAELEGAAPDALRRVTGPNGETWGGRGRKPRWLIEAEAAASDSA
jgi:DNA-binding protein H-NS